MIKDFIRWNTCINLRNQVNSVGLLIKLKYVLLV